MGMKYTKIPVDAFEKIQLNAGILVKNFDPATGEATGLFGATTGGMQFNATPAFTDFGDDIDNCPKNMKELKNIDSWDVSLGGTFVTVDTDTAKALIAAADIDANNANHVIPRRNLIAADFQDIWWIGDYSDVNTGASAGYCAIHLMNALNTGGFQIKSTDKGKGNFAFTFTGHVSMDAQDVVPFELFIKGSGAGDTPFIVLDTHNVTIEVDEEITLGYEVNPSDATVSFSSSASGKASVDASTGVVKGLEAGSTIITASFTDDGVPYSDTCTVIVTAG
jgi:hypothetical protein